MARRGILYGSVRYTIWLWEVYYIALRGMLYGSEWSTMYMALSGIKYGSERENPKTLVDILYDSGRYTIFLWEVYFMTQRE
jgi:hypothetical protein